MAESHIGIIRTARLYMQNTSQVQMSNFILTAHSHSSDGMQL